MGLPWQWTQPATLPDQRWLQSPASGPTCSQNSQQPHLTRKPTSFNMKPSQQHPLPPTSELMQWLCTTRDPNNKPACHQVLSTDLSSTPSWAEWDKWKWQCIPNLMGCSKRSPKTKVYSYKCIEQEERKISHKQPNIAPQGTRKRRTNPKVSIKK